MSSDDCVICFCPFEKNDRRYTCVEPDCKTDICKECLHALITFSESNELIPKCPSSKCHGIYIWSGIRDVPKDIQQLYYSACFKFMMKDQGDHVKKGLQEEKILSDIRNQRLMYLEKEYPLAISLVAKITFTNKLRHLDKQKAKIASAQVSKANKGCFNLVCNGFLDPNYVCMMCSTEFCRSCEKKLKTGHVCQQEDLDSVNLVNNMIKCPGCKLPVFKNEGCDSITCSNCSTNFQYSTGQVGGHGSSNAKLAKTLSIQKKEKLSDIFAKQLDEDNMESLIKLEALEPSIRHKETILHPLKGYLKDHDRENAGRQIAKKIDEYYTFKITYKRVHVALSKVEEKLVDKASPDELKITIRTLIADLKR